MHLGPFTLAALCWLMVAHLPLPGVGQASAQIIRTHTLNATTVPAVANWTNEPQAVGGVSCGSACTSNTCSAVCPTGTTTELAATAFQPLLILSTENITRVRVVFSGAWNTTEAGSVLLRVVGPFSSLTSLAVGGPSCSQYTWDITALAGTTWTPAMVQLLHVSIRRSSAVVPFQSLYVDAFRIIVDTIESPENDDCFAAAPAVLGVNGFDITNCTTGSQGQSSGCGVISNDQWFRFAIPSSGWTDVSTCGLTAFDTRLAVYDAGAGGNCPGTIIACSDNAPGCANLTSRVHFFSTGPRDVIIQVGSASAAVRGFGQFSVNFSAAPADECAQAIPLISSHTYYADLTSATNSFALPPGGAACDGGSNVINRDVWYSYTTPRAGLLCVSTISDSVVHYETDTKLALFSACGGSRLACSDNDPTGNGYAARVFVQAPAGATYIIQAGLAPGAAVDLVPVHARMAINADEPAQAETVPVGIVPFDFRGATLSLNVPGDPECAFTVTRDLWFRGSTGATNFRIRAEGFTNAPLHAQIFSMLDGGQPGILLACGDPRQPGGIGYPQHTPGTLFLVRLALKLGPPNPTLIGEIEVPFDDIPERRCTIDISAVGGHAGGDGVVGVDDLVFYLGMFFAGDVTFADTVGLGGGPRDNHITVDDLVFYLGKFFDGCP